MTDSICFQKDNEMLYVGRFFFEKKIIFTNSAGELNVEIKLMACRIHNINIKRAVVSKKYIQNLSNYFLYYYNTTGGQEHMLKNNI